MKEIFGEIPWRWLWYVVVSVFRFFSLGKENTRPLFAEENYNSQYETLIQECKLNVILAASCSSFISRAQSS